MGTETKQTPRWTPKGYRIEGEEKYLLTTPNAELGPTDATDCEVELWQINEQMLEALKAMRCSYCGFSVGQHMGEEFEPGKVTLPNCGPHACVRNKRAPGTLNAIAAINQAERGETR